MSAQLALWVIFGIMLGVVYFLPQKYSVLRDTSTSDLKPYSFSRVQLAWWTVIVLSSFICTLFFKGMPTLAESTLILLGMSGATTASARLIDVSDRMRTPMVHQNMRSDGFWLDILSDANGVSIHRLQAVLFNLTFGVWFLLQVSQNLGIGDLEANDILPIIEGNNLILLGLSSATYAAVKSTENK